MDKRERARRSLLSGGEIVKKGGGTHDREVSRTLGAMLSVICDE